MDPPEPPEPPPEAEAEDEAPLGDVAINTKRSLRDAILWKLPLATIRSLVEGRPQSVREMSPQQPSASLRGSSHPASQNRFPLAISLQVLNSRNWGSSEAKNCADVALYLLKCWPKAATKADLDGELPVHLISPNWPVELVQLVVEASGPKSLLRRRQQPHREGGIPLHCALAAGCGCDVVRIMVGACPGSVRVADDEGRLALHLASRGGCDPALVEYLVQTWPDAAQVADNRGMMPLHLACVTHIGRSEEGLSRLVRAGPDALRRRDGDGRLPLHHFAATCMSRGAGDSRAPSQLERAAEAARWEAQLLLAQFFVDTCPESVRAEDSDGNVPLHDAVRRSVEVSRLLVERWPGAVRHANRAGALPLHHAVGAVAARVPMVRLLVGAWPGSVRHQDTTGSLPLHRAVDRQMRYCSRAVDRQMRNCSGDAPDQHLEAIRLLVRAWPHSVRQRDGKGSLPLHTLVHQDTRNRAVAPPVPLVEAVRLFVRAWPDSVRQRDGEGYLPLHRALTRDAAGWGHALYLVEQWPESVREWTESDGPRYLPIHLAVHRADRARAMLAPVRCLVEQWPESIRVRCDYGLPLHMAFRSQVPDLPLAGFLILQWPASLLERDADGRLPLHLAVLRSEQHVPPNVVAVLVRMGPGAVRERDNEGRLPIHAALSQHRWSWYVARILVGAWAESLRERDGQGRLPLHLAAAARAESAEPGARLLVEAWPQALHERDSLGRLPLHASVQSSQDASVVRLFVRRWPGSVRERDGEGRLPLHLALGRGLTRLDVVQILVEPWTESVRERDGFGRLPLHIVLDKEHPSATAAKLLVELWPQSANEVDANGLFPLQLAAVNNAELGLLFFLARLCPDLFFRG